MTSNMNSGEARLMAVDKRRAEIAQELNEIQNGQAAKTTGLPTEDGDNYDEFDHQQWLEAELIDASEERERLERVVTVDGRVEYE